jgi:hypothetical protein
MAHFKTFLSAAGFLAMVTGLGLAADTPATAPATQPASLTGKWTSEFDSQVGHQKYTYDLKSDGEKLTGKAHRDVEGDKTDTDISEGKIAGDQVSFVELLHVNDQDLRIEYKGKVSGDEMKLTRAVGDFATTEIVAKRAPDSATQPAK